VGNSELSGNCREGRGAPNRDDLGTAARFIRRQGEALHPEREPLEVLDRIRRTIGEYNFAG
jgi:hypothetical protein